MEYNPESINLNPESEEVNTIYYIPLSILCFLLLISCIFFLTDGFDISVSSSSCIVIILIIIFYYLMQPKTKRTAFKNNMLQKYHNGMDYLNQQYTNYMPDLNNQMNYPQMNYPQMNYSQMNPQMNPQY